METIDTLFALGPPNRILIVKVDIRHRNTLHTTRTPALHIIDIHVSREDPTNVVVSFNW